MIPRFSIIMPLYNKRTYIERSIVSVLRQEEGDLELIVVDDGSDDGSADQVAALSDPRIRLIRQVNAGVSAARNHGIRLACGEFVAFLDADDEYDPDFTRSLLTLALDFPGRGLYCASYRQRSNRNGSCWQPAMPSRRAAGPIDDIYALLCQEYFFHTSSLMIPRRLLLDGGFAFPLGEQMGEDQDLWLRVAEAHGAVYLPKTVSTYHADIADSLTAAGRVLQVLPFVRRLQQRMTLPEFPAALRPSARRFAARQMLGAAWNNSVLGHKGRTLCLLLDPMNRYALSRAVLVWLSLLVPPGWLIGLQGIRKQLTRGDANNG